MVRLVNVAARSAFVLAAAGLIGCNNEKRTSKVPEAAGHTRPPIDVATLQTMLHVIRISTSLQMLEFEDIDVTHIIAVQPIGPASPRLPVADAKTIRALESRFEVV